ncbi:MAG: hypothetical protein Q9159_000732 [Coniocarpon cinnabarinum]
MDIRGLLSLLLLLHLTPLAATLGVNCRGSRECRKEEKDLAALADAMNRSLEAGNNWWYHEHEHIACVLHTHRRGNTCAFFAKDATGFLSAAYDLLNRLIAHGCISCGSQPIFPVKNNVKFGELTVNFVNQDKGTCEVDCSSTWSDAPTYWTCLNYGGKREPQIEGCPENKWNGEGAWSRYGKLTEQALGDMPTYSDHPIPGKDLPPPVENDEEYEKRGEVEKDLKEAGWVG